MRKKILLVEDDQDISQMTKEFLENDEFDVTTAYDGEEGIQKFKQEAFDLMILDIMMPKLNGLDCLKIMREKSSTPILIMSAKDSDIDKALGLGFGADDYLSKPFSMIELLARVKAIIRRATQYSKLESDATDDVHSIGNFTIDFNQYKATKNGDIVKLTPKEFEILKLLIKHPNQVYTKAQLYNQIWDESYMGDENVINTHISRLREKIEDNPSKPKIIITLWGIGYKLGKIL